MAFLVLAKGNFATSKGFTPGFRVSGLVRVQLKIGIGVQMVLEERFCDLKRVYLQGFGFSRSLVRVYDRCSIGLQ